MELPEVCNWTLNVDRKKIWVKSGIIPILKPGDLADTGNYRRISLTVIAAKMYNKLFLERIRSHLDPLLRTNQNGFCQIVTLRRMIKVFKVKQSQAVITFVDFKKAFDSIHQVKLMKILSTYGVPKKIVDAMSIVYKITVTQVIIPDG